MGELLRIPAAAESEQSIEQLMAELLEACRRRVGETPEQFARGIGEASPRRPELLGAAIRAAERGIHPLHADLMAHAVTRAGIDAAAVLTALLRMVS